MQVTPPSAATPTPREIQLRAKATELEAAFLSEMLSHAGFDAARDDFGGGTGEDQFTSFLRSAQAKGMANRGGIGLAEHFFRSLMARADGGQ